METKELKEFQDQYLRNYQPIFKNLSATFYSLSEFLKEKSSEFENDEKLKKFAPAVTVMAEEANKFSYAVAWGTVSDKNTKELTQRIKNAEESDKIYSNALAKIKPTIDKSHELLKGYKTKPPTAKAYATPFWNTYLRNIGVYIATAETRKPGLKAKFAVPLKTAAMQWAQKSLPQEDEDVPEQIKKDVVLVTKFKAISDLL